MMKKRLISLLLLVLLVSALAVSASAAGPLVVDEAGVLSAEDCARLEDQARRISDTYGIETIIYYTDTLDGKSSAQFTDDFWYENGYSPDCSIFMVAVVDREYYFYNRGLGSTVITDYGSEYIDGKVIPYLSDGDWSKAAGQYLTFMTEFYNHYAETGTPYDVNEKPNELKILLLSIFGNTGIGLLLAGLPLRKQKKSMNTVAAKTQAQDYLRKDSFQLSLREDAMTGQHTSRTLIPRTESTGSSSHSGGTTMHSSSHGGSFSGHGGKF